MQRKIVDHQKLTREILSLLVEKYPNGYSDKDIITFRNARNEMVEAVEVKTRDTIYLVKVSKSLANTMKGFDVFDLQEEAMSANNLEIFDDLEELEDDDASGIL